LTSSVMTVLIKIIMLNKTNKTMKTYHIELECGEATVYAPSRERAILNFFNWRYRSDDSKYSIKKDKGELNLYVTYGDFTQKLTVTEVTEEGVITFVEH